MQSLYVDVKPLMACASLSERSKFADQCFHAAKILRKCRLTRRSPRRNTSFYARITTTLLNLIRMRVSEQNPQAQCASDAESLEMARALLFMPTQRQLGAIYRCKSELVDPQKNKIELPLLIL
jgi:hypothetical protein